MYFGTRGFVPNITELNIKSKPKGRKRVKNRRLSNTLPHHMYVTRKTISPDAITATPVTTKAILAPKEIDTISYLFLDDLNLRRP